MPTVEAILREYAKQLGLEDIPEGVNSKNFCNNIECDSCIDEAKAIIKEAAK